MYVVIPTAIEPHNPTLRYALNSIRTHTGYEPVTVGHDFGLCEHLPTVQLPGVQYARLNTNAAMRAACEAFPGGFIWSNDDIYWMRPAAPIRWALGDLEHAAGSRLNRQRKAETARTLHAMLLPTFDYEAHVPLPVEDVPAMLTVLDIADANPNMLEKRSLYGNLTGAPDRVAPDVKLRAPGDVPGAGEWVSTQGHPARFRGLLGLLVAAERPGQGQHQQNADQG